MEIISTFGDRSKAEQVLSNSKHLSKLAHEFCHEFDTRVSYAGDNFKNSSINLELPNGMLIGNLSVASNCGEPIYIASMPSIITKERSSKWSGSDARDSEKLPNLIRAIKKNKEQPTEAKALEMFNSSIYYALGNICNTREPDIGFSGTTALDALKALLGIDTVSVHQHMPEFQRIYDNYMKVSATVKDSQATHERFMRGCTMIYIEGDRYQDKSADAYYVADFVTEANAKGIKSKYTFHTPLKRYNTLRDSEYGATVAMIRSYMESIPKYFNKNNELGVKFLDHYFDDMDFAVGNSNNKLVVLLPKHAP